MADVANLDYIDRPVMTPLGHKYTQTNATFDASGCAIAMNIVKVAKQVTCLVRASKPLPLQIMCLTRASSRVSKMGLDLCAKAARVATMTAM